MFSKLHVQCTCTQLNDNYNNFVICRSAVTKLVYLRDRNAVAHSVDSDRF